MRKFQSTLPLRGATRELADLLKTRGRSIHTPPAGSDGLRRIHEPRFRNFNPHSPCGERQTSINSLATREIFQSTLPLRGATIRELERRRDQLFQSTLPLRGATIRRCRSRRVRRFQSTLPLRGATKLAVHVTSHVFDFNPHSPCGERLQNALNNNRF